MKPDPLPFPQTPSRRGSGRLIRRLPQDGLAGELVRVDAARLRPAPLVPDPLLHLGLDDEALAVDTSLADGWREPRTAHCRCIGVSARRQDLAPARGARWCTTVFVMV